MTQPQQDATIAYPVIERVLTCPETLSAADLPHIHAAGLSGAVRAMLPEGHPQRATLRGQALELGMRHTRMRAELRPLLAAWAAAGIPVLLMKGFALAEFEYASPSERFYGDVDVLLPEDWNTVIRAMQVALAHGWRGDGLHAHPELWTHEAMHLFSPNRNVRLDVHRFVVGLSAGPSLGQVRALTQGVWRRALELDWEGLRVYRAAPLDAAVVNVALGRSWGGDMGGFKPADYLDLAQLTEHHGLSSDVLNAHAARLGVLPTWNAVQQCVNPLEHTLHLNPQVTRPIILQGVRDQGFFVWKYQAARRFRSAKRLAPHMPAALLDVAAAWWALRQAGDPRTHLRRWTPARPTRRLPWLGVVNAISAVNWWTRLFYPKQRQLGVCVPRAYATYRALRRQGHPAVFISGVGKVPGGLAAHAWVEDDYGNIGIYAEPLNRQRYKPVFTYPEASVAEASAPASNSSTTSST